MRWIVLILIALPTLTAADTWQMLRGEAVRDALQGRKLIYDSGAWQHFHESGRTLYNAGVDSWGYWRVQSNQYCSMWPPSDLWACYDLWGNGQSLRFVDASEEVTEARYAE